MPPLKTAIVLATALCRATAAMPAETEHFTVTGMQVIRHSGEHVALANGTNDIDNPHTFVCKSEAGCSIVVHSVAHLTNLNDSYAVCALIDEKPAQPPCTEVAYYDYFDVAFQGQGHLAPGAHTVRTVIQTRHTEQLVGYQFLYTLYEH